MRRPATYGGTRQGTVAQPPRPVLILATWLVIFPEVLLVNALLMLISSDWNVFLRTAVLTAIVIPPAVLWLVPALAQAYLRLRRRSRNRATTVAVTGGAGARPISTPRSEAREGADGVGG